MAKNLFSAYRANGKFKLANALESTRRGLIEGDKAMKLMRDIAYKKRKEAQVNLFLSFGMIPCSNVCKYQMKNALSHGQLYITGQCPADMDMIKIVEIYAHK